MRLKNAFGTLFKSDSNFLILWKEQSFIFGLMHGQELGYGGCSQGMGCSQRACVLYIAACFFFSSRASFREHLHGHPSSRRDTTLITFHPSSFTSRTTSFARSSTFFTPYLFDDLILPGHTRCHLLIVSVQHSTSWTRLLIHPPLLLLSCAATVLFDSRCIGSTSTPYSSRTAHPPHPNIKPNRGFFQSRRTFRAKCRVLMSKWLWEIQNPRGCPSIKRGCPGSGSLI